MADYDSELRATPEQRPAIGALARFARRVDEFARKPFGYDNPPVQMLSNALGIPALYNTAENFAYGSPLTRGTGQARQLNPEVKEAALAATQFAGPLGKVVRMTRDLPVGMVIKPKGGNWLEGSVEESLHPLKNKVPNPVNHAGMLELQQIDPEMYARLYERHAPQAAVDNWIDKQLTRYVRNEMATPEDPLRALAEKGVLHYEPQYLGMREKLPAIREAAGFPAQGMGRSDLAKLWEMASDPTIESFKAGDVQGGLKLGIPVRGSRGGEEWINKLDPEAKIYGADVAGDELGFRHLIDEMRNATNPESGLPRELLLKYSSLPQVSVPQAVERVAKINEWRAAQKIAADQARANNAATVVHKEYPGQGYKWVELKNTPLTEEQRIAGGYLSDAQPNLKALEDALKYEGDTMGHCVGGYCPDVSSGKSRIFSLRNEKTGEPHVTIEVNPNQHLDYNSWFSRQPEEMKNEIARRRLADRNYNVFETPEYLAEREAQPPKIAQIKGKGNKAPKEDYLPFVQDFVRSGKWSDVGDIENTGLHKVIAGQRLPGFSKEIEPGYYSLEDFNRMAVENEMPQEILDSWMNKLKNPRNYAKGGAVEFDPARVDEIAQGLRNYEPSEGLAPLGIRHSGDSVKGKGYFGLLPHASGVATEISGESPSLGEYPLIVPTLSREELDHLLSGDRPTEEIYNKAEAHALKRIGFGKNTFAQPDELHHPLPEKFAQGGAVEYNPAKIEMLANKLREELHG